MSEMDELAKRRTEVEQTTNHVRDGIFQFIGFNTSDLLERTLKGAEFEPIHPSEAGEKAYAVRRRSVQSALEKISVDISAAIASIPEGSAYYRSDMNAGDTFTVELSRDLRLLPGNPEVVLYTQLSITAFNDISSGLTRIAFARRPGSRHDFLKRSGAFEPLGRRPQN